MARSVFARRRRIKLIGLILLGGVVTLVLFFVFGKTKPVSPTPIVLNIGDDEEDEEEEESVGPSPGPASTPGPAPALAQLPRGRFVKLEQTVAYDEDAEGDQCDKSKVINLAEVEVLDTNGTNLAFEKAVTGSSQESSTNGYFNLTDGRKNNFTHTACVTDEVNDYLQIDLGSVQEIKKIVITNRSIAQDRAIGIKAIILGGGGQTVIAESPLITTVADEYILTFPENVWS